jgi:hypothetical protein
MKIARVKVNFKAFTHIEVELPDEGSSHFLSTQAEEIIRSYIQDAMGGIEGITVTSMESGESS